MLQLNGGFLYAFQLYGQQPRKGTPTLLPLFFQNKSLKEGTSCLKQLLTHLELKVQIQTNFTLYVDS